MSGHLTSPTSTTHPGLYRLPIAGTGLSASERDDTLARAALIESVVEAIGQAVTQARDIGLASFSPAQGLPLPDGVSAAQMDDLFREVLGMRYLGTPGLTPGSRELTLAEWSDAALTLRQRATSERSRLSPSDGGGISYADGHWYVNGQPYSLAEGFLAVRVSSMSAIDGYLLDQMNRTSINASMARKLVGLIGDLNALYLSRGGSAGTYAAGADLVDLLAAHDLTLADLSALGGGVSGGGTFAAVETAYLGNAAAAISATDYAALVAEAKSIFDGLNADNQVNQVRTDSVVNQRQNIIESMSYFMKSYAAQQAQLARVAGGVAR